MGHARTLQHSDMLEYTALTQFDLESRPCGVAPQVQSTAQVQAMDTRRLTMLSVSSLRLHSENPRLPETLAGASQETLLKHLHENAVLDELAISFVDNGFFAHEPLIVSQPDEDGNRTVFEGNRRLATLKILLGLDIAEALEIAFSFESMPTVEQLNRLWEVPCFIVKDLEEVHRFLGFRHIGGIKTWSAEAKARYLVAEVLRAHKRDSKKNPFTMVGRAVGSNAQGVRNPYIAMKILIRGREQFGIDTTAIQQYRFGVWNRAMNSPALRSYIGFGDARTFQDVEIGLNALSGSHLQEVLKDMRPGGSGQRAVLADSRDVTIYSAVLQDDRAHEVLRRYDDLALARQIVEQAGIPQRIRQIGQSVEILNRLVERQGAPSEALPPARELAALARSLSALVEAAVDEYG